MDDHPDKHHRRSIRIKGYDYSQPGGYFVTICVHERASLLGQILNGEMICNDAGKMVVRWWAEINHKFPTVEIDEFVVMPNHFHGIVILVGADLRVRPGEGTHAGGGTHIGVPLRVRPGEGTHAGGGTHVGMPLHTVVQWFKTMTTNEYIRGVKQFGWMPFRGKLWQRNYYEHIIRDQADLDRIRRYIAYNPLGWEEDREFNPNAR